MKLSMSNSDSHRIHHGSISEEMLKLKTEELISKTQELKQTSNSLLASNNALKLKAEELDKTNKALLESQHELAFVNKELAAANRRFTESNKRFAQVNEQLAVTNMELTTVIKELALANEQVKVREKMTTDFINIAAHELRTPIQSILGYSEILQILSEQEEQSDDDDNNNKTDNEKKKALEAISRNAIRLDKLAKDILDVARIDSNTLTLNKQCFNLNEKIRNVISDTTNQIRNTTTTTTTHDSSINDNNNNKNIKIIFEPAGANDIFVEADKIRIYQVISNLLRNAVKFTKEGGTISITTDVNTDVAGGGVEEKRVVVVKIKDSGTGIDPEIMPRLFTKFATKSQIGTGLGLFISKSIVEAHGGRIWAENNNSGKDGEKGATFRFSLPLNKQQQ